jgi:predicted DNA-binding ribbon-helix-helix protein
LKKHYKEYCKLLAKVITLAKKIYYSIKLANSTNKPKTIWNIIKTITNNQKKSNNMLIMEIEGNRTTHCQNFSEKFNTCYISVTDNIQKNNPAKNTIDELNN